MGRGGGGIGWMCSNIFGSKSIKRRDDENANHDQS